MEPDNNEMERLYAETFRQIEEGTIFQGRVVSVRNDGVLIDIGYKSEGFIPAEEFTPGEFMSLKSGDVIDVYVVDVQNSEGVATLSKEKATKLKAWETIESAFEDGAPVPGVVSGKTKGGFNVDLMGVNAFMPSSQTDARSIRESDNLVGKTIQVRVLKLNNKRSNIIVSRKALLDEERQRKKMEILPKLTEGARLEGIVKNITDYGVFVDLGGIDGLLHISDISWGRITHPSEFFALGDSIEVIVLKYDGEQGRVTLGYKQRKPDPWLTAEEKYAVNKTVKGKVVSITEYGAFVELEEGIEGLVHLSELDWSPRPKHPSKYLTIGETIEAVVLRLDKDERRLSMSVKQTKPSPWVLVSERYSVGQMVTGKIKSITEFGGFVGLPEGVDGLIHISDISWTRHINHPSEVLKKGQKVDAVILSLEPEKERIALGLKQVNPDPWLKEIPEKFKLGDEVKCRVLKLTDFGVFAGIEDDVEGLIYSSEVMKMDEPLKEGDEIVARIIKIDTDERKIGLSMKNVKGDKS